MTAEILRAHLQGTRDIGLIPLLADGRCAWAAVDIDADDQQGALKLREVLREWRLPASVFTSRRRGFHVLLFFEEPVSARLVRRVLQAALRGAGLPASTERFPKQDDPRDTAKGLGNWLRLPYFGGAAPGRRVALDDAGRPLSLASWLATVERIPPARVPAVAADLEPALSDEPAQVPPQPGPEATGRAPGPPGASLSPRIEALLVHGDQEGRYRKRDGPPDRSRIVQAIVDGMANAGQPEDLIYSALRDPNHRGGARVREILASSGEGAARAYVRRSIEKARRLPPPISDADGALQVLELIWGGVAGDPREWKGIAREHDRVVLEVLLTMAEDAGSLVLTPGVRAVAWQAGLATATAHRALLDLERRGWLRREHRREAPSDATTLRLRLPARVRHHPNTSPSPASLVRSSSVRILSHPREDVWRGRYVFKYEEPRREARGVAKASRRTWEFVLRQPGLSARALAGLRHVHRRTMQRQLARLAGLGLVVRDDVGRWWVGGQSFAAAAQELGINGAAQDQKQWDALQRQRFREWVNDHGRLLAAGRPRLRLHQRRSPPA